MSSFNLSIVTPTKSRDGESQDYQKVRAALLESEDPNCRELFLPYHADTILYIKNGSLFFTDEDGAYDQNNDEWTFNKRISLKNAFIQFSYFNSKGNELLIATDKPVTEKVEMKIIPTTEISESIRYLRTLLPQEKTK